MTKQLNDADITAAALDLGVEEAVIRAVIDVETGGKGGFINDDHPRILFEALVFWKRLKAHGLDPSQYQEGNEDVLCDHWDRTLYKGGLAEYARLEKASLIHLVSALESASWGLFQVLGRNWKSLGYASVQDFVNQQYKNEREQLFAFLRYVKANQLTNSLRNKDWAEFAEGYNGPGYAENHYDTKLQKAYIKHGGKG